MLELDEGKLCAAGRGAASLTQSRADRRETGQRHMNGGRVRDAQEPEPKCMSSTGELIDIERVTISSEGERWKSTRWGNSLAVYPTSRPVLRRGGESNLASLSRRVAPFVTVDRRIAPSTAVSERSVIVSCHAAPQ